MDKKEYIKAIEELNYERIMLQRNNKYRKIEKRKYIKSFFKARQYKKGIDLIINNIINKCNRNLKKKDKIREYKIVEKDIDITETKKVVYTCVLDEYDKIYSPLIKTENTKYIIFSDDDKIIDENETWEFRAIPEEIKKKCNDDKILINRYIKMHAKELFPEYDYALYIDGSIRVISDIEDLFKRINDKTGLGMHKHPKREDVYEEAYACILSKKGNKKQIKKQIKKYKEEKFPEKYGLFEATIIAIDIKNKKSEIILNEWWDEFFMSQTYRDQLIFTYILWKNKYEIDDIGILGETVHTNPKFRRNRHKIKSKKKDAKIKKIIKLINKKIKKILKKIIKILRKILRIIKKCIKRCLRIEDNNDNKNDRRK